MYLLRRFSFRDLTWLYLAGTAVGLIGCLMTHRPFSPTLARDYIGGGLIALGVLAQLPLYGVLAYAVMGRPSICSRGQGG